MKKIILLSKKKTGSSPYGAELVTDGGFDNPTDWFLYDEVNSNISNSRLNVTALTSTTSLCYTTVFNADVVIGKNYLVEFTLTADVGNVGQIRALFGGVFGTFITDGKYSAIVEATSSLKRIFFYRTGEYLGTMDGVSVREVL